MAKAPVVQLDWDAAIEHLNAAQTIAMVTHVSPDGDAFGSMCGLGLALREQGKTVHLHVDAGTTEYLSYVPGSDTIHSEVKITDADLVISLDASDLPRIGETGAALFAIDAPKLVIDHHATNLLFGDVHILDSDFVSTTEAVYHLLKKLEWDFSSDVAKALMVGFVTDTISFRVGPVTATTFEQVADLLRLGDLDLREIVERMLLRVQSGQLQLMGVGYSRLKIENHVAYTWLEQADFIATGVSESDKPELASDILRDENAYVACFLRMTAEGEVKISLRSVPGFDVGSVAYSVGGGGHTQAAGATLGAMSIEDAIAKMLPLLLEAVQTGSPLYQ